VSKILVYLAGPITGSTQAQAHDWREDMRCLLRRAGECFEGVSPLRCEPLPDDYKRYGYDYEDPRFGTPTAIAAKNRYDVKRCDVMVAYFPQKYTVDIGHPSIGTLQELGWSVEAGTPRIVVTDLEYISNNAVIRATCPWVFGEETGFQEAVDVIAGIWEIYA
jgi:nucleoside 2-deoxyribosyltransferase